MRWTALTNGLLGAVLCAGCGDSGPGETEDPTQGASDSATTAGPGTDTDGTDTAGTDTQTGTDTGALCPGSTPDEVAACVEQPRYEDDLRFIADIRTPGSTHWQAVQDLCADRLTDLGYDVELQNYGTGINVLGTKTGVGNPDETVLVTAHYDHIPNCSGADDNATGVSGILEIARVLALVETPRTLVVACWDEEELGLIGAEAYVAGLDAGATITGVFNFDMIGYKSDEPNSQQFPDGFDLLFPEEFGELEANEFRADFLFWVSDDTMEVDGQQVEGFAASLGLPVIGAALSDELKSLPALSDLRRSDHAPFWDADIPAMFLTDSSEFRYSTYHCADGGDDVVDNLDHEFATKIVAATAGATAVALGL